MKKIHYLSLIILIFGICYYIFIPKNINKTYNCDITILDKSQNTSITKNSKITLKGKYYRTPLKTASLKQIEEYIDMYESEGEFKDKIPPIYFIGNITFDNINFFDNSNSNNSITVPVCGIRNDVKEHKLSIVNKSKTNNKTIYKIQTGEIMLTKNFKQILSVDILDIDKTFGSSTIYKKYKYKK